MDSLPKSGTSSSKDTGYTSETNITGLKRKPSDMKSGFRKKMYDTEASEPEASKPKDEPESESAQPAKRRKGSKQPTVVAKDSRIATSASKNVKRRGRDMPERAEALTNPSEHFMDKQEIDSRARELSDIAKNIPESLLFDSLVTSSKRKRNFITQIAMEYKKLNNTNKSKAASQLSKAIDDIESYKTRPTQYIDNAAREEVSLALIDAHRLLTDLFPEWSETYPQLRNLHTHIDTALKELRNSDNPPAAN
jgi:hypothetical protein